MQNWDLEILLALSTLRIFGKAECVNNLVLEHSSTSFRDMIQAAADTGKTHPAGTWMSQK